MQDAKERPVLLVGSVPLGSSRAVFEAVGTFCDVAMTTGRESGAVTASGYPAATHRRRQRRKCELDPERPSRAPLARLGTPAWDAVSQKSGLFASARRSSSLPRPGGRPQDLASTLAEG